MNKYYDIRGFIPDPKYFVLQEFVPPDIYEKYKDKAWRFIDTRILISVACLRYNLKIPLVINNWHIRGNRQYCGFRPPDCKEGADLSSHKRGSALDVISSQMEAEKIRQHILDNPHLYPYVTYLEGKVSWTHMECSNLGNKEGIYVFNP